MTKKEYQKLWYLKNKKRILANQKAYRENTETDYNKKRREKYDPVKKKEQNDRYRLKNKDEIIYRQKLRRYAQKAGFFQRSKNDEE